MEPGERDSRVEFLQAVVAQNAMGEDEESEWGSYAKAWAQVVYGKGSERRAAAQEDADLSATFRVPYSAKLAALTVRHRVRFAGADWDISSVVPVGDRDGIEVTATRKAR